jgi:hypothetical protein
MVPAWWHSEHDASKNVTILFLMWILALQK